MWRRMHPSPCHKLVELNSQEQAAYSVALQGEGIFGVSAEGESIPLEEQGCTGEAALSMGVSVLEDLADFETARAEGLERVWSSAAATEAIAEWSRCMQAAGYSAANTGELRAGIRQQMGQGVTDWINENGGSTLTRPQQEVVAEQYFSSARFDELLADEVRTAQQDADCFILEVSPAIALQVVELEQELVQEFRAPLEAVSDFFRRSAKRPSRSSQAAGRFRRTLSLASSCSLGVCVPSQVQLNLVHRLTHNRCLLFVDSRSPSTIFRRHQSVRCSTEIS